MSGKLKVKGNVMKGVHKIRIYITAYEMLTPDFAATKLEPILAKAKTQSKL